MKKRGERHGMGGDVRNISLPTVADLGFRHRTLVNRWQKRARSSPPSFNLRLAAASDLAAVMRLIAEAKAEGLAAVRGGDHAGHRVALARRMAASGRRARCCSRGMVPP